MRGETKQDPQPQQRPGVLGWSFGWVSGGQGRVCQEAEAA